MKKLKLYNEDCLKRMDKLIKKGVKVQQILTDPPYGMSFQSNNRQNKYDVLKQDDNLDWLESFAEKCYALAADNTAHYIFCSFHNIDIFKQAFQKHFKIKNILIWEKNGGSMGDLKADFSPKVEFILFLQKGRRFINGKRDPNIFRFNRTGNLYHPTQKPVDMMEYLLSKFSDEGDLILDPFMGSGTTGVACVNMKRRFIGIELDETFFKVSSARVDDAKRNRKP